MKLTDLNLDCLESILEYLEFGDLLNVASSNKRLNAAAGLVYIQEHKKKGVIALVDRISRTRLFIIGETGILIKDLKTCLQLVRCFGRFISIAVVYVENDYNSHVLSYINEYCNESLTKMEICCLRMGCLNAFIKPFVRVERVAITFCCLDVEEDWLKSRFPQIKHLMIGFDGAKSREFEILTHHFQHLEQIEIEIRGDMDNREEGIENLKAMLQLNPQLKVFRSKLVRQHIIDAKFFQNVIEHIQSLETLDIGEYSGSFLYDFNGDIMHLKNVKHFSIDFGVFPIVLDERLRKEIPFSFDQLESFTFRCPQPDFFPYFYDFLSKNTMIKKLKVRIFGGDDIPRGIVHLANSLLSLEELEFFSVLSIDLVIDIAKFKSLKLFSFSLYHFESREELLKHLDNTWNIKYFMSRQPITKVILERQRQVETH